MKNILFFLFLINCFINLSGQTTVQGNFTHNGINRTYRLYIPAVYNSGNAVPLILNLHGYSSNALEQELYSNFKPIADTANFIIVHPDGTTDGTGNQFWNSVGLTGIDDVDFLSALIDTISMNYNIDQNCIYSTGMSNGGFMSHKLACDLGTKIAAIASVTGTMIWNEYNSCSPSHPTPIMQIHGTADPIVPYYGSVNTVPVDSVISLWVDKNNCSSAPVFTAIPDINPGDGCIAEHYMYSSGDNGSAVEFYKIINGGHTWPGSFFIIGVTNQDFNASAAIWTFFRKYKLNVLTSQDNMLNIHNKPEIYPNPSTGKVTIKFNSSISRRIYLTDIFGKIICELFVKGSQINFDIENKGLYFINVAEGDSHYNHKIVIF